MVPSAGLGGRREGVQEKVEGGQHPSPSPFPLASEGRRSESPVLSPGYDGVESKTFPSEQSTRPPQHSSSSPPSSSPSTALSFPFIFAAGDAPFNRPTCAAFSAPSTNLAENAAYFSFSRCSCGGGGQHPPLDGRDPQQRRRKARCAESGSFADAAAEGVGVGAPEAGEADVEVESGWGKEEGLPALVPRREGAKR